MTGSMREQRGTPRTGRCRIAAMLLVLVTPVPVSCSRSDADSSADQTRTPAPSTPTPAPVSDPAGQAPSLGPEDAVRTVVVSDQSSSAARAPAWPDLLSGDLGGVGIPMSVETTARDGAGFTSSPAFAELVARSAEGSTQLVVLFDGRLTGTGDLSAAVEDTFAAVERAAPDALLVVVGPLTTEGTAPSPGPADLAAATRRAGGTYVDPDAEGWSTEPTQPELAALLRPHLQPLVETLAATGANR